MNGIHPTSQKHRLLTAEVAGGKNLYTVLETRTRGSPRAQLSYSWESTRGRKLYVHVLCSTVDNRLMQDPPVQRAWCILTVEYET